MLLIILMRRLGSGIETCSVLRHLYSLLSASNSFIKMLFSWTWSGIKNVDKEQVEHACPSRSGPTGHYQSAIISNASLRQLLRNIQCFFNGCDYHKQLRWWSSALMTMFHKLLEEHKQTELRKASLATIGEYPYQCALTNGESTFVVMDVQTI